MIPDLYYINTQNPSVVGIGNVNTQNPNIRDPYIREPVIRDVADLRIWTREPSQSVPYTPPVVLEIGKPIVDMPGCVQVHKENARERNKNKQLVNDDTDENVVLCDSGMPAYAPMDYKSDRLTYTTVTPEAEQVKEGVKTNEPPPPPDTDTPEPPATPPTEKEDVPCPPPNARRIGDLNQAGTERVKEYKLIQEGTICETVWEPIPFIDKYLPSPGVVTTTATIAVVATSSALLAKPLADLLLKVVKPAVKKAIGAIQKKLGKTPYSPTQAELRTNRYREKKGMLGINFAKQHSKREKARKESQKSEKK